MSESLKQVAYDEAQAVLNNPDLRFVFDGTTLAEVPVTAQLGRHRMHGTIDRLIVTADSVHIIDFKSNRTVPDTPQECPEGVLRQMGAYAHAMAQVYPDRAVKLGILWTRSGQMMELPHDIVTKALSRTPYLDDAGIDT